MRIEKMRYDYAGMTRQLKSVNEQNKASAEGSETRIKCMIIARRIMSGDEVPIEDYRFLLKNDPELYGKAVMMRIEKENPVKHKKISGESDEKRSESEKTDKTAQIAEILQKEQNGG